MPQDKLDPTDPIPILEAFAKDVVKELGKQHEGCYRVDIMRYKIDDLIKKYKDKIKNT